MPQAHGLLSTCIDLMCTFLSHSHPLSSSPSLSLSLPLSQVEVGSLELTIAPFSVVEELETLLDMFAVHCIGSGVDLSMDVSDDMPEVVMGDAMRFRQIVSNLLSNSVKFTESGHVRIRAWVVRARVSSSVSHCAFSC